MGQILAWLFLVAGAVCAQPAGIEGTWQGTLNAGAIRLRLGLHVTKADGGEYTSTLDSIDQNAMGIPVMQTVYADHKLHLEMPNMAAKYDGTLNAEGTEISGVFIQGAPVNLSFKRVEKIETLRRPQNPTPPFPYVAEDIVYENKTGIKLAGTLTLPRGNGHFAAAIMITGSGPQDRDQSLMGHKPFLVIADDLTRRGVAVLRLDDRGVGKSTGNSMLTTMDEMAGDVLAGVDFLKGRKQINAKQIGVIGHSEGGIVGPLAASRSSDIAFVVMLAGTGVTGEQILYTQGELVARAGGAPDQAIARQRALQEMIFGVMKAEKQETDQKKLVEKLRAAWDKMKPGDAPASDAAITAEFNKITFPEMRSFLFYDPADTLRKLKVPVLAMNGARDVQVSPLQNLPAIAAALAAGGNSDFTITELPGLNHLFQHCKTCAVSEYGVLDETFSPAALEIMGEWIVRHTGVQH